jgi:fatty acid synthase subunit beta
MELAEFEHLRSSGLTQANASFAGHSLGEYAALGACTTLMSLDNLLNLVFYRGLKMQNALERDQNGRTEFSMVAVDPSRVGKGELCDRANSMEGLQDSDFSAGFDEQALQNVVKSIHDETGFLLEVVNYNVESQQYVCAGHVSEKSLSLSTASS